MDCGLNIPDDEVEVVLPARSSTTLNGLPAEDREEIICIDESELGHVTLMPQDMEH